MVPFDSSVCQFNVFLTLNDCHEVIECFAIPAFRIHSIKDGFHAVVFRVSDFSLLLFSPLRSQHRHPLLSGWIFLVLLEAVFVVSWCYFHWIRLVAFPPPLTFSRFHRYYATTFTETKNGYCPLTKVFPSTISQPCNRLNVFSFLRSDISIMGRL